MCSIILPDLVVLKILDYLSWNDLIRFRNVSKKWKSFIDNNIKQREELILFFKQPAQMRVLWKYKNQRIDLKNALSIDERVFSDDSFLDFFEDIKIKRLLINSFEHSYLSYKSSDQLSERMAELVYGFKMSLEHLELGIDWLDFFDSIPKKKTIYLPKLKSLCCRHILHRDFPGYNYNLKNLEYFSTGCIFFDAKKLEWIKNLKYLSFTGIGLLDREISGAEFSLEFPGIKFLNLEILYTKVGFIKLSLSICPSLKQLHLSAGNRMRYRQETLEFYLEEKIKYGRNDLEIYVEGFKYSDELIKQIHFSVNKNDDIFEIDLNECAINYYRNNPLDFKTNGNRYFLFLLKNSFLNCLKSIKNSDYYKDSIDKYRYCFIDKSSKNLNDFDIVFENCTEILIEVLPNETELNLLPKYCPNAHKISFVGNEPYFYKSDLLTLFKYTACDRLWFRKWDYGQAKVIHQSEWNVVRNLWEFVRVENERISLSFLSKFKCAKQINFCDFRITFNELKAILDNCKYLAFGSFSGFKFRIGKKIELKAEPLESIKKFKTKSEFLEFLLLDKIVLDDDYDDYDA